eukprot:TRINITY_DN34181_c0_g1_i1.p1 TRINITY_DN34181_c0_g1~~TRINITY_DN34181_c0_g1_i1.p1  ORF type:complete len:902 (+),score=160.59 TRINITY_DN34181_c0_g1_i1:126-2831(+)
MRDEGASIHRDELDEEEESAALGALRTAIAEELADRHWPLPGQVVSVFADWDGPSLHDSDVFLSLAKGDRVSIIDRTAEGLLYGTVPDGRSSRGGWFGGKCCKVVYEVPVPVGPDEIHNFPMGPPVLESRPIDDSDYQEAEDCSATAAFATAADFVEAADASPVEDGDGAGLADEVEDYIESHGINGEVANALRDLEPALQKQVIVRDLNNCRNPSAVLRSRIERLLSSSVKAVAPVALGRSRSPRRTMTVAKGPAAGAAGQVLNVLLPVAASARVVPQSRVGNMVVARSAATTVNTASGNVAGPTPADAFEAPPPGGEAPGLPDFIHRFYLDEKAAKALRDLPRWAQNSFMETGLVNCRNPSAVVSSRIQGMWLNPLEDYIRGSKLDAQVAAELRSMPPEERIQIIDMDPTMAVNPSAVVARKIQVVRAQRREQIGGCSGNTVRDQQQERQLTHPSEDIAKRLNLDDATIQALGKLLPEQQHADISQDLKNARNPSAVLLSRVQSVGQEQAMRGQDGVGKLGVGLRMPPTAPNKRLDPGAVAAAAAVAASAISGGAGGLRSPAPVVGPCAIVLTATSGAVSAASATAASASSARCGPKPSVNPNRPGSSVGNVWRAPEGAVAVAAASGNSGFIANRELASRLPPQQRGRPVNASLDEQTKLFIERHRIDDKSSQALMDLPPHLRQPLMEIELVNCRNPSAVVWTRIQDAIRTDSAQPLPIRSRATHPPLPGLATAASTTPSMSSSDMQGITQLSRSGGLRGSGFGSGVGGGGAGGCDSIEDRVEDYIFRFDLDDRVAQDLRSLPIDQQNEVTSLDLVNPRNPSAIVASKIRVLKGSSTNRNIGNVEVEDYIGRHDVDTVAAQALRDLSPELQRQIMEKDLSNCRNASAVLLSRVRAIAGT